MFVVISLAPKVATTSSRRSPSWIVIVVVGPNSWPCSAATIWDGAASATGRRYPQASVPSRPAVMTAYWKAIWLLISPSSNRSWPIERVGRARFDDDRDATLLVAGAARSSRTSGPVPAARSPGRGRARWRRGCPRPRPSRAARRSTLKPSTMATTRSAIEPAIHVGQQERLHPAAAADRSLALLAKLANARVAAVLVLAHGRGASAHSVSSGGPVRRRASRYCCRIRRAAVESSSPALAPSGAAGLGQALRPPPTSSVARPCTQPGCHERPTARRTPSRTRPARPRCRPC